MFTIGLLAGLFVGAFLGSMLMSLLVMSKTSSRFDPAGMDGEMIRANMSETGIAYPALAATHRIPHDTRMV